MKNNFTIKTSRPHFRTLRLEYQDSDGNCEVYLEQSTKPDYDWIGDISSLNFTREKLFKILNNIEAWSNQNDLRIKIWKNQVSRSV
jgi:hypothetical protein